MNGYEELAQEMGVEAEANQTQILATEFKMVEITLITKEQRFSQTQESKIQEAWNKQKEKAGNNLWNDPMASLVNFSVNSFGGLELVLRKSDYKIYVGTRRRRLIDTDIIPMDKNSSLPISLGAITITSDNFIVLGLRSGTEAYEDEVGLCPSGYLDPSAHFLKTELKEVISVEELILCELYEELRMQTYTSKAYLALIQDMQPMIAVRLVIPFTRYEVEQIARINFEHSRLIYIENTTSAVKRAFREYRFTPHALAAILCHLFEEKQNVSKK